MSLQIISRNEDGSIVAIINGQQVAVPDDMGNRDRQAIAEWEAAGNVLPSYVAPVIIPDSVSSRQFKLQLLSAGLLDQVDAWVKTQPRDIQIAYEYSGSFVRSAPMMAEGFAAMGFTSSQIDDFFTAASKL